MSQSDVQGQGQQLADDANSIGSFSNIDAVSNVDTVSNVSVADSAISLRHAPLGRAMRNPNANYNPSASSTLPATAGGNPLSRPFSAVNALFGNLLNRRPAQPNQQQIQYQTQYQNQAPQQPLFQQQPGWAGRQQMPPDNTPSIYALVAQRMKELPLSKRHMFLEAVKEDPTFTAIFSQGYKAGAAPDADVKLQALADLVKKSDPSPEVFEPPSQESSATAAPALAAASTSAAAANASEAAVPALTMSLVPEYSSVSAEAGQALRLVVSLKAAKDAVKRAEVALTCVLDRSGSMSGGRMELVQETSHFLISQLTRNDFLGFVSYSNDVTEDLPLVKMTPTAKEFAHRVIDVINANGGTALYDGMVHGLGQQLQEAGAGGSKMVHACFLCTDGEANVGPQDADSILPGLRQYQQPFNRTLTVHTFGFGQGHSASLLQAIADAQAGVYYYVAKSNDIPEAYGDALGGLVSVVAKDVKVTITPINGCTLKDMKSGGRISHDTTATSATAGSAAVFNDIFAEETREMLLQLELPAVQLDDQEFVSGPVVQVDLEYVDAGSGQIVKVCQVQSLQRSASKVQASAPDKLVYETAARFDTAAAIEQAQKLSNAGQAEVARKMLDQYMDGLNAGPVHTDLVNQMVSQTKVVRENIKDKQQADTEGQAMMSNAVSGLRTQRAAAPSSGLEGAMKWDSKSKSAYRSSAQNQVQEALQNKRSQQSMPPP